ncbi:MAG: DinB family protein [Anaerolineae bacterium]
MIHPQALIKMFGYNAEIINKQTAVLSHEDSLLQLPFDANCLNWVLGHIISSRTMALQWVGAEPVWTEVQRSSYRHLSPNVLADSNGLMRLEVLVADFNLSQERLVNGLNRTTYDEMCRPSGYRDNTVGDSLAYFHFHEAQHVGQILYLAQFAGKEGVWIS